MSCPNCQTENVDSATYCGQCGTLLNSGQLATEGNHCHVHPDVETGLSCGSCERPICVQCVVQHPVGIRCRECARLRKIPTLDVSAVYYARAAGAGVGIGIAGTLGLVLGWVLLPFWLLPMAGLVWLGYLIGEGINRVVNRKRSRPLQYIAGGSVLLPYFMAISPFVGTGLYGLLALAAAIYVAVSRLRIP